MAGAMRTFLAIWFGQLISTLGFGLTGFALGVYIYQRTGSVTELSLAVLAASLPGILLSPIAGVVVDRWDRRWILVLSDTGAALSMIVTPLLAGFLVVAIQLEGVILIDFATFLFAVLTLLLVRIPMPKTSAEGVSARGSFWREAGYGWKYLKERPDAIGQT
jgi:MFS family permease